MRRSVLVLVLLVLSTVLFASPLSSSVPNLGPERTALLLKGESLKESTVDGDILSLVPEVPATKEKIASALSIKKGFSVSQATLVPYPKTWTGMSEEELEKTIYNTVLKVSTMKGLIYISHRAGDKPKVLFEESSMLASSNKKDTISDPQVDTVPREAFYHAYQKDTTFGGNVYSLHYSSGDEGLFLDISNETPLSFMGISLVAEGKVSMFMTIVPVEEGIYVHSAATILDKSPKVNLLVYSVDLEDCFMRRIEALKNWFIAEIGE
ncbi:MAG: hypothetical protein KBS81_03510 [Spirochaetales bacterium]|nr:hypothetical protein [Candidatus Physcosoma equi]